MLAFWGVAACTYTLVPAPSPIEHVAPPASSDVVIQWWDGEVTIDRGGRSRPCSRVCEEDALAHLRSLAEAAGDAGVSPAAQHDVRVQAYARLQACETPR